jgi:hypothetical protein
MSNARENVNLLTSTDWDIATLRLANWGAGAIPPQVILKTNRTAGDGGGVFRYDAADTTTADNGGTVIVDAAGNRWKRQWDGPVHSDWFYAPHPSTVQTTALQAFLNAGSDLFIDPGTVVSASVTIPAGTTVRGTRTSVLLWNTATGAASYSDPKKIHIELLGDNITLEGFTVDGSWTTDTYAGGFGIYHIGIGNIGTSGTNRNYMTLRDMLIKNYGYEGVRTEYVNFKTVESCIVTRCGYGGMIGLSTNTAWYYGNYVHNIFPGAPSLGVPAAEQNAYGITETSDSDPAVRRAEYIVFEKNRIDNVVSWEGLDIHFGKHCLIHGNIITNCSQGIAYENSTSVASDDIIITDNIVLGWSGATTTRDGQTYTKTAGIIATGGSGAGTTLSIIGNNVTGMGDTRLPSGGSSGAIFFRNWIGVICSQNNIRDSYARGIAAGAGGDDYVINLDCSHNTIINVQQDPNSGVCRGIEFFDVDGSGVNNFVTGLSAGSEKFVQNPAAAPATARRFKFIQPKETLLANTTYFVRTDGNNSNIGTANTTVGAFLTVQGAIDHISANVNTNGKTVTIQIDPRDQMGDPAGIWTTPIVAKSYEGNGNIIILGNETTPSQVVISTTSADCFRALDITDTAGAGVGQGVMVGKYSLRGLKFQTTTSGSAIWAVGPIVVDFQNCDFGTVVSHHIASFFGARVVASGNYPITGGAATHMNSVGGTIDIRGRTVTLTGTPAFGTAFANSSRLAQLLASSVTFSGSATGTRYNADGNAVIFTSGGGASYFPGSVSGTTATGGQYI